MSVSSQFRCFDILPANESPHRSFLVQVLDEKGEATGVRMLKYTENSLAPKELARDINVSCNITKSERIHSAEKIFVSATVTLQLSEYLPHTLADVRKKLFELSTPLDIKKTDPLGRFDDEDSDVSDEEEDEEDDTASESEAAPETEKEAPCPEDETPLPAAPTASDLEAEIQEENDFFPLGATMTLTFTPKSEIMNDLHTCEIKKETDLDSLDILKGSRAIFLKGYDQKLDDVLLKTYKLRTKNGFCESSFPKFFFHIANELVACGKEFNNDYGFLHGALKDDCVKIRYETEERGEGVKMKVIRLVWGEFYSAERLSHNYDVNFIPFMPVMPPEFFFKQPIVPEKIDAWSVGLLLGNLLNPKKGFFPDPNDSDNEDEDEEEEEDEEEKEEDEDAGNKEGEEEEEEESAAWGKMTPAHVDWFSSMTEARALMQWVDEDGINYDEVRDDTGVQREVSDDEQDDIEEDEIEHDAAVKSKEIVDGEEVEAIDLDAAEKARAAKRRKKTPLTEDEIQERFKYVSLTPSNLDDFVSNLAHRRDNYEFVVHELNGKEYTMKNNLPYWMFRFWLQMFVADPSLRPNFHDLQTQLDNPTVLKKFRQLRATKHKPLVISKPSELVKYEPFDFKLHNAANWDVASTNIAGEWQLSTKETAGLLKQLRPIYESKMALYPEILVLALELYARIHLVCPPFVSDAVFEVCLELVENLLYNEDLNQQDPEIRKEILLACGGKIESCLSIEQLIFSSVAARKDRFGVILSPEVLTLETEFGLPITFGEILQQISTFLALAWILSGGKVNAGTIASVVEIGLRVAYEYCQCKGVEKRDIDKAMSRKIVDAVTTHANQDFFFSLGDEDENTMTRGWISILPSTIVSPVVQA